MSGYKSHSGAGLSHDLFVLHQAVALLQIGQFAPLAATIESVLQADRVHGQSPTNSCYLCHHQARLSLFSDTIKRQAMTHGSKISPSYLWKLSHIQFDIIKQNRALSHLNFALL
jgi:hypothetical protein